MAIGVKQNERFGISSNHRHNYYNCFFVKYSSPKNSKNPINKIKTNAPIITILGWVFWTLAVLSGPLMNFQMTLIFVVGGLCIFIYQSITSRDQKVDTLTAALLDAKNIHNENFDEALIIERAKQEAEENFVSRINPIDGVENLKREMHLSLQNAHSKVLVMSGWASEYVIDEKLISLCVAKLSSGIELHLGFGYNSSNSDRMPAWEKKGRTRINELMKRAMSEGCDDNLFIYEFDNHYKSLVKDEEYFITGSINWLSNNKGKNFERAWKTEIPELAEREFNDCISIMRPKRLIQRRKLIRPFIEWNNI